MTHLSLMHPDDGDDAWILPPRGGANSKAPPCDCFAFKNPSGGTLEENAVPHVSDTYEIARPCRTLLLHSRRARFCFAWDCPYAPPQRQEEAWKMNMYGTQQFPSPYLIKHSSRGRSFYVVNWYALHMCLHEIEGRCVSKSFPMLTYCRDRLICGSWWSIDCQVHHPSIADPAPSFIAGGFSICGQSSPRLRFNRTPLQKACKSNYGQLERSYVERKQKELH